MGNAQVPSDANGVYSLPSGYEAVTGEVIQASQHNPPLEDLESAVSARLMRSGVAPMTGALKIVDGAVGSPAVQFNSVNSTGFYKTTNGIGVSVNGVKVAEFTSGGVSRNLGELIPYTGLTAPALTVLPYGQTLSRTTYADLWAFAQAEIAAGNTFYNNGNGTTTFGISDLRGIVVAGKDNMGGSAAGRISLATSGMNGNVLGATGGEQVHILAASAMPVHAHTGSTGGMTANTTHDHSVVTPATPAGVVNGADKLVFLFENTPTATSTVNLDHGHNFTTNNAGSGGAHNNIQPTIICNYILYAGA